MTPSRIEDFVERVLLSPGWTVALATTDKEQLICESLRLELWRHLEEEEDTRPQTVEVVDLPASSTEPGRGTFLVTGLDHASRETLELLDLVRDRLVDGQRFVVVTTEPGLASLRAHAPNIWSWIGPNVYPIESMTEKRSHLMSLAARLERERMVTTDEGAQIARVARGAYVDALRDRGIAPVGDTPSRTLYGAFKGSIVVLGDIVSPVEEEWESSR
jgi:hypothetical protein